MDAPPRLAVNFFGLFGPNGPLPLHLTEYARNRLRAESDPTLVRFIDLFHHRMLTLFYRVWAAAQPTVSFDRPETDRFALYVGSLFGLGMPSLRNRDAFPDLARLHYAGQLACQTRHPDGLNAMISDYFVDSCSPRSSCTCSEGCSRTASSRSTYHEPKPAVIGPV